MRLLAVLFVLFLSAIAFSAEKPQALKRLPNGDVTWTEADGTVCTVEKKYVDKLGLDVIAQLKGRKPATVAPVVSQCPNGNCQRR